MLDDHHREVTSVVGSECEAARSESRAHGTKRDPSATGPLGKGEPMVARILGVGTVFLALLLAGCGVNDAASGAWSLDAAALNEFDTGEPIGEQNEVTPSTNALNEANGWAHVILVGDARVGEVDLNFVAPRAFYSCFEYRVDESAPDGPDNPNTDVTDGLWPYTCQNASSETMTIEAESYVDVRMVFGGERDERFDWTRFYVAPTKFSCMDDGWVEQGFRNQGQCVRYYVTGKDSRLGE